MLEKHLVNHHQLSGFGVDLIPMNFEHQDVVRSWRNQDEIRQQMLDDQKISEEQQLTWFNKMSQDPKQLHWVIRFRDALIGATNVQSLEDKKPASEASLLAPGLYIGERRYQGNIVAFAPTLVMYDFCFQHLSTQVFRAVVKADNHNALKYNQKLGYELTVEDELCVLELNQERYQQATAPIRQFLSRSGNSRVN